MIYKIQVKNRKMEIATQEKQEISKNGLEELTNASHSETHIHRIPMVGADLEIYRDMEKRCTYLKNPIKVRAHLGMREICELSTFTKNIYPHPDIVRVDLKRSIGAYNPTKLHDYFGNGNGNGDGKEYKEIKTKVPGTDEKSERILRMYTSHLIDHYSVKQ